MGRPGSALLGLAVVVLGVHATLLGDWVIDDAGISFAYARNLARGAGLVSQPGMLHDPVDATTRRRVEGVLRDLASGPDSPIERVLSGDEPFVQDGLPEGSHGQLPEPGAMDASFLVAGPGVPRGRDLGRVDMRDVAPTLAALMGVALPSAEGRNLLR